MTELDRGFKSLSTATSNGEAGPAGGAAPRRRELPSLPLLFSTPVEPLEVDDIDYMTDE